MCRMRIIHVCSCENCGIIPVIFSEMVSKNSGVGAKSNVIPVKFHVHVFCVYLLETLSLFILKITSEVCLLLF